MKTETRKRGFTLIELLVGISIIAILGTIGFSTYSQSQLRGRDFKRKQDLRSIATGLELYYQQFKRYPCSGNASHSSKSGWALSANTSSSWLKDIGAGDCASGTSNTDFAPTYINQLPRDPSGNIDALPDSTNWQGYAYFSGSGSLGSCSAGSYYLLVTRLENPNDSERLGAATLTLCGTGTVNLHANSFVVSDPK